MHLIVKNKKATDFIIASGKSHSLKNFIHLAFDYFGLDWKKYTKTSRSNKRPLELLKNSVPFKIKRYSSGKIFLFTDNTNCRAFWYGTNRLLMNAIYLSNKM